MVMYFYIGIIVIYFGVMLYTRRYGEKDKQTVSKLLYPFIGIAAWLYSLIGRMQNAGKQSNRPVRQQSRRQARLKEDMAVLYPDRMQEQKRAYFLKKGAYILAILFAGNVLALCIHIGSLLHTEDMFSRYLQRNGYGEGARTETLSASIQAAEGNIEEEVRVSIQAQEYTESEAYTWIDKAIAMLPKLILGDNESFDYVTGELNLIQKIDDIPVSIEWVSGNYRLMDHHGRITASELPEEGTVCMLTAKVSCQGCQKECTLYICLYPKAISYAEQIRQDLYNAVKEAEEQSRSESQMALPQEVNGESVVWSKQKKDNSVMFWILAMLLAIGIWYAMDKDVHKKVEEREVQMRRDYPELISKLVLFMGAGMTIRGAVHRIAAECENHKGRAVYEEFARICHEMDSGIAEGVAYLNLGKRCKDPHYVRLSMLLSQNLRKGNAGLTQLLEKEAEEAFEERKRNARKYGEEAATKLLLPMFLMLMIVMVVIMVPAFLSFGG